MRRQSTVRTFCSAVFLAGMLAVVALSTALRVNYVVSHPLTFVVLAIAVVLAETLPVKIPRRGSDEEITLSTSFAMALLLAGGLGPAVLAQAVASMIQDAVSGKPGWRMRFNVGQYTLSLVAAFMTLRLLSDTSHIGSAHPFAGTQLPALLLSAAAYFAVNTGLVGIAVALYQGVPVRRYFQKDLSFVVTTAGVLLLLAPIVIATTAYSPLLVPLFAAPILAIHKALWAGARSQHAARHDQLTGLPNRAAFREVVESVLGDRARSAAVLLMDLDRFKDVNDTLGHHYGDLLLQEVAQRLLAALGKGNEIARLGGDEFAVLSEQCTREEALCVAQRIADALKGSFELEQIVVDVQASVGIAMFPADGIDVETLLQKADVAMYQAKEQRTNSALYDERRNPHSTSKLALSADLRAAIGADELEAWYQPELDLATGTVFAVEALVRWPHRQLGLLPPDEFVEMAEHTNLIKPLTQHVLEHSLWQLARWRAVGLELSVAVNISTAVLIDNQFARSVVAALERARVSPSRLKLEITESTLMRNPEVTRAILLEFKEIGIEVAIDDFGTGYSSLAYLADLPVSEVKIDRSFVGRMAHSAKDAIIVNSTIDLAHHLGLRAIAEGVEEPALLARLRAQGCDAAQGYAISAPLRADEITTWLLARREMPRIHDERRSAA